MNYNFKILSILSCSFYTLCAAEQPHQKIQTAPPSPIERINAPTKVPKITQQFPNIDQVAGLQALLPAVPNNSPEVLSLSPPLATSAQKDTITEFITGFSVIISKRDDAKGQNVHDLDQFMIKHIPTHLLKTMQELHIGDNMLTKELVIAHLKENSPDVLKYENKNIPKAVVYHYIDSCIHQAFTQSQTQELFSRYVTVLADMDDKDHYNTLLNSIAENYATGGGCWAGVRNRCAVSLAYLVAHKIDVL